MAFRLITRADDFGSARSANSAILEALAAGHMVRNVSCMAPGKYIEQDAGELVRYAGQVDFGLHYTLNSEWDSVKWNPCAPKESIPSLLDQTGNFYPSSEELRSANIRMEEAIAELDAQLERLTTLGIPITYVDGHMFPDRIIPGLDEEMKAWAKRKGILCTNDCFALWRGNPEFADSIPAFWENVHSWLQGLPSEGYGLYVFPSRKIWGGNAGICQQCLPQRHCCLGTGTGVSQCGFQPVAGLGRRAEYGADSFPGL